MPRGAAQAGLTVGASRSLSCARRKVCEVVFEKNARSASEFGLREVVTSGEKDGGEGPRKMLGGGRNGGRKTEFYFWLNIRCIQNNRTSNLLASNGRKDLESFRRAVPQHSQLRKTKLDVLQPLGYD